MSLLMNMTLFSLFPGSEGPHSIGCHASTVTISPTMTKKRENAMFLFRRGRRVHISTGDGAITSHH